MNFDKEHYTHLLRKATKGDLPEIEELKALTEDTLILWLMELAYRRGKMDGLLDGKELTDKAFKQWK